MEPLEFQRDWESRNAAGYPGPAGDVALHDTDPGVRPGSWAPAREGPTAGRARHAADGPRRPPAPSARPDDMFNEPYSGGDWRNDPGYGYDNVGGGGAGPYESGPDHNAGRYDSGPYNAAAGYDAGPYNNGAEHPGPYDLPVSTPPARTTPRLGTTPAPTTTVLVTSLARTTARLGTTPARTTSLLSTPPARTAPRLGTTPAPTTTVLVTSLARTTARLDTTPAPTTTVLVTSLVRTTARLGTIPAPTTTVRSTLPARTTPLALTAPVRTTLVRTTLAPTTTPAPVAPERTPATGGQRSWWPMLRVPGGARPTAGARTVWSGRTRHGMSQRCRVIPPPAGP